jgi:predicted O-methyltransferase YrrM
MRVRFSKLASSGASSADVSAWFAGKDFTTDWVSKKMGNWLPVLAHLRDRQADVLEVGTYEGRSAIAFLSFLPQAKVTCIDTFQIRNNPGLEERFDRNVAEFGERVVKIKDRAANALDKLRREGASYDAIYLDAGKGRDWVFALSALAWPLLRVDGVLIWDDLAWGKDRPGAERPAEGIRLFRMAFAKCLDVLYEGEQLITRKIAAWP